MKEVHFYTNLANEEQTSEWDLDTMCVDYVCTVNAINDPDVERVKTTQICLLINAWDYIDDGCRVFIHNDMLVFEVKDKMVAPINGKEIRRGHRIDMLLMSGVFGEVK